MRVPFFTSTLFFFNDTATTEIYTLSLHDALPICPGGGSRSAPDAPHPSPAIRPWRCFPGARRRQPADCTAPSGPSRSEEHTSELQSRLHLVCRLLLEKKKSQKTACSRMHSKHGVD